MLRSNSSAADGLALRIGRCVCPAPMARRKRGLGSLSGKCRIRAADLHVPALDPRSRSSLMVGVCATPRSSRCAASPLPFPAVSPARSSPSLQMLVLNCASSGRPLMPSGEGTAALEETSEPNRSSEEVEPEIHVAWMVGRSTAPCARTAQDRRCRALSWPPACASLTRPTRSRHEHVVASSVSMEAAGARQRIETRFRRGS